MGVSWRDLRGSALLLVLIDVELEFECWLDSLAFDSLPEEVLVPIGDAWVAAEVDGDEASCFVEADAYASDRLLS